MECNCAVSQPGPSLARCGGSMFSVFMLMLEKYLRYQCDIEDPCGQITSTVHPLPQYDFIVVGAGSAGSVVASRLSEVPEWKVLLIEAGVNEPTSSQVPSFWEDAQNTTADWQYVTEPESTCCLNTGGSCRWPRGKVLGGTSVLNSLNYIRGNKKDYDNWASMGNTGWSYKDVLPYFIKSENNLQIDSVDPGYHGVGGLMPISLLPFYFPLEKDIIEAAREMGQRIGDPNGENQLGFSIPQTITKNGIRFSSSRAFIRPVKNRENLHVLLDTLVTKVLIDDTKKAIGVEIMKRDGIREKILTVKEVVVCGGAIGSPKVLLQSGIGDEESLNGVGVPVVHPLPGVGRNLHDHVGFVVEFTSNQTNVNDLNWDEAAKYLRSRDGAMSTSGNSIIGFVQSKYANQSENYPDLRFQFRGYQARCSKTGAVGEKNSIEDSKTRKVSMNSILIQPKSRGYLTLRDNNPKSPPKIFSGYLSNPVDMPPIIEGIKFLIKLSETKALQKYGLELIRTPVRGCEDYSFGSDTYWECAMRRETDADYHQAGSCKMGPDSDPEAVVDPQLRVRGLQGVRVADASIMPQVCAGNTHGPIVMIAEKASDMIKQKWLS